MIYLVEYDRRRGLQRLDEFSEECRREAEGRRLSLEIDLLKRGVDREIVLLEASSTDELRKTHRRYFEKIEQLLQRGTSSSS